MIRIYKDTIRIMYGQISPYGCFFVCLILFVCPCLSFQDLTVFGGVCSVGRPQMLKLQRQQ